MLINIDLQLLLYAGLFFASLFVVCSHLTQQRKARILASRGVIPTQLRRILCHSNIKIVKVVQVRLSIFLDSLAIPIFRAAWPFCHREKFGESTANTRITCDSRHKKISKKNILSLRVMRAASIPICMLVNDARLRACTHQHSFCM